MARNLENLKRWRKANREKNRARINANKLKSYYKNKQRILAAQKERYDANRAAIITKTSIYAKAKRKERSAEPAVIAERAARKREMATIRSVAMTVRMAEKFSGYTSVKTPEYNRERGRRHYQKPGVREAMQAYGKVYRQRPEVRARLRLKEQTLRKSNPQFALRQSLRCRIRSALVAQSTYKTETTEALLGCTIAEFKAHLQSLFLPGMHWNNRSMWHIDHRRPCSAFDLSDPEQQRQCFHFTNLQPLWKLDNLRKGSKVLEEGLR